MSGDVLSWIICQIGARERYALARELHRRGQLTALCTDIWVTPRSLAGRLAPIAGARGASFRERYDPVLANAKVLSGSPFKAALKGRGASRRGEREYWQSIMDANCRFGATMSRNLKRYGLLKAAGAHNRKPAVFAYSYAAREIFETAKKSGCLTVLGQIDPGPVEDDIVAAVAAQHGFNDDGRGRPPAEYWANWREECEIADVIAVNSQWSADCLIQGGVNASKIRIVPLSYEAKSDLDGEQAQRSYPSSFSTDRPLQLLFLGQIGFRKGAFELLEAMERLQEAPVRLSMVGPAQIELRERFGALSNVEWIGKVPYGNISAHYRNADVFLLTTHSDGFALTQLEAQAAGLPVFASTHCGSVVVDGSNGRLINEISSRSIEELILWAIDSPKALQAMSGQALKHARFFPVSRSVGALMEAVARHS